MTPRGAILQRFRGEITGLPLFLPNLTLWHGWHSEHGTLPAAWQGWTLPQIARDLDVPTWLTARPYVVDWGEVEVARAESTRERLIRYRMQAGELTERWTLGPDGDWWQTEYPVKTRDDLGLLLQIAAIRRYVVDTARLERSIGEVDDAGVVALELPRRPFSQVFLEWLGWSDGLLLFFDAQELVEQIIAVLEDKVQTLVEQIASLPGQIAVSPDSFVTSRLDTHHPDPPEPEALPRMSLEELTALASVPPLDPGAVAPVREALADAVSSPPADPAALGQVAALVNSIDAEQVEMRSPLAAQVYMTQVLRALDTEPAMHLVDTHGDVRHDVDILLYLAQGLGLTHGAAGEDVALRVAMRVGRLLPETTLPMLLDCTLDYVPPGFSVLLYEFVLAGRDTAA